MPTSQTYKTLGRFFESLYFAHFNLNLQIYLQIAVPVGCGLYLWWLYVQVMPKKGTGRPMTCLSIKEISQFLNDFDCWLDMAVITFVKVYLYIYNIWLIDWKKDSYLPCIAMAHYQQVYYLKFCKYLEGLPSIPPSKWLLIHGIPLSIA